MDLHFHIHGGDFVNAGKASSSVKGVLKRLDVSGRKIKRVVVALYEAEVNVVAHAHEGEIRVSIDSDRVRVVVEDKGPGIPDISKAMEEGYSTASKEVREMGFGAGMGLPNIKRNTERMEISSLPGVGTTLIFVNDLKD
ncbi:MAG: anti-sigma regulatory factor [Bacteroidales bacterium]